jgi:hypothetical protein
MRPSVLQNILFMCSYKQSEVETLGKGGEVLILRSWQLSRKKRVGGGLLAWPTTADSTHSTDHNGNSYFQLDT